MTDRITWHRYVRLHLIPAYEALGWIVASGSSLPVPHGCYSVIMDWAGEGEPVELGDHGS